MVLRKAVYGTAALILLVCGYVWVFGCSVQLTSEAALQQPSRSVRATFRALKNSDHLLSPSYNPLQPIAPVPAPAPAPSYYLAAAIQRARALSQIEIVIVAYNDWKLEEAAKNWQEALKSPKIAELLPFVTVYCQNEALAGQGLVEERLAPILTNGQVIYLNNVGREGRPYLWHIIHNWDNLLRYTWFSQDEWDYDAMSRLKLFNPPLTGMLNVGPSWGVECDDLSWPWDHADRVTRLQESVYVLVTGRICEYYYAVYKGQFIVSADRIRRNNRLDLYQYLLSLLEAPRDHHIHSRHGYDDMKEPSNPWFGHAIERAWSLLFDCYDPSMKRECDTCEDSSWKNCTDTACQCYD